MVIFIQDIYDLVINDVNVIDGNGTPEFRADVAINFNPAARADPISETMGVIADIGDMNFFAAKDTIDGKGCWLTPGFITVLNNPQSSVDKVFDQLKDLLLSGFTSVLVPYTYEQIEQSILLKSKIDSEKFSGNVGGLLKIDNNHKILIDTLAIIKALGSGFIGVVDNDDQKTSSVFTEWFKKPSVYWKKIEKKIDLNSLNAKEIARITSFQAKRWNLSKRGTIKIGQIADLILLTRDHTGKINIKTIFIKGFPIISKNQRLDVIVKGDYWLPEKK